MTEYTEEQRDEIRAAVSRAINNYDMEDALANTILAELRKPDINPDVPVMFDFDMVGTDKLDFARALEGCDAENIRVLIPADTVIDKAKKRDAYLLEYASRGGLTEVAYWQNVIATYSREGLSTHGGER